jgi:excisionase family DNA binding protein
MRMKEGAQMRKLLTVSEAACRLALKEATIRKMILQKKISYVKFQRAVRIPEDVVEKIVEVGMRHAI